MSHPTTVKHVLTMFKAAMIVAKSADAPVLKGMRYVIDGSHAHLAATDRYQMVRLSTKESRIPDRGGHVIPLDDCKRIIAELGIYSAKSRCIMHPDSIEILEGAPSRHLTWASMTEDYPSLGMLMERSQTPVTSDMQLGIQPHFITNAGRIASMLVSKPLPAIFTFGSTNNKPMKVTIPAESSHLEIHCDFLLMPVRLKG